MKKIFTLLFAVMVTAGLFAQSPEKMSYQAIIRDASNELITSSSVGMQISILQGSADGTALYTETQDPTTNENGLVTIEIGEGTTSDDFSAIDWANGPYFIKTETDPTGGTDYSITGVSQLLSVPYALHAKSAGRVDTENDPLFNASIASEITSDDTTFWNDKSEFDGDYSTLTNAPDLANTTNEKVIKLNTNDATSSFEITKNNESSVFKVDGTGKMTGDGSGLSNVKILANFVGGFQRKQIIYDYEGWDNVRQVSLTVPSDGIVIAQASGFVDWESENLDLLLIGMLMDQDPNSSPSAEQEWWDYNVFITDYNCTDSSDQYTSFSLHRCFYVSAGTRTFYLWANRYATNAVVEVRNIQMSVMFIPTGGTGKSTNDVMIKEEGPAIAPERKPRTLSGHN
jgi:hypothetical protein